MVLRGSATYRQIQSLAFGIKRGEGMEEFVDGYTLMYLLKNISGSTIEALEDYLDVRHRTTITRYLNQDGRPKFPTTLSLEAVFGAFNKLRDQDFEKNTGGFVAGLLHLLRDDLEVPTIANELQELYKSKLQELGEESAYTIFINDLYIRCKSKYTCPASKTTPDNIAGNEVVRVIGHGDYEATGKDDVQAPYDVLKKMGYLAFSIAESLKKSDHIENAKIEDAAVIISSAEKMCEKAILMKYGHQGIDTGYLSRLRTKEKIPGMNEDYYDLSELISDYSRIALNDLYGREIRLLLSGDVYTGRTTQLLTYCKKGLSEDNIVLYISPHAVKTGELFTYIHESYLKELFYLKNCDAKTAFKLFKDLVKDTYKITIVIDGYDYTDSRQRNSLDSILKYEDPLISDVNVIVKVRFRDTSWPQNYIEVMARGVSADVVREEIIAKKIDLGKIQPIVSSLQSPWLLKMLINDVTNNVEKIVNSGQLIRQSIADRVEAMTHIGMVDMDVLRFSVHALLPQLAKDDNFLKTHLLDTLPAVVNETVKLGVIPECYEVEDHLLQLNGSKNRIFNVFFGNPIVETMDLMKEITSGDRTKNAYEWKDYTVSNYFYAAAILNLFNSHDPGKAVPLIDKITDGLLLLDKDPIDADIDRSVFVSFDIARYLFDLTDDDTLIAMQDMWPEQMAVLHCEMAMIHELFGKEEEKFGEAMKALSLLDKLYDTGSPDRFFFAHWYNKMAYYVIKYRGEPIADFPSVLDRARDYLEKAIKIVEEEYENVNNYIRLDLSKMYGNMGAYFLKQKDPDTAKEWHQKSKIEKEKCLESCESDESKAIREGLRRSLEALATDHFYMGDHNRSIEYHNEAIRIGEQINSRFRYESYSRIVGSYIKLLNEQSGWSSEWGEKLFDLLIEDIKIMGEYVNRNEIKDIYKKAVTILEILNENGFRTDEVFSSGIIEKARSIEDRYNSVTWGNKCELSKFFMTEVK